MNATIRTTIGDLISALRVFTLAATDRRPRDAAGKPGNITKRGETPR